jgi:steroid Delta-isomerase
VADVPERVEAHVHGFHAAIVTGDWSAFLEGFCEDATMRFGGVPVGPFEGRAAIARAFAENPPTDTMRVAAVVAEGDEDAVTFAWSSGGAGTMRMRWRDGRVAVPEIRFV